MNHPLPGEELEIEGNQVEGKATDLHYDRPFFCRGSQRVHTVWIALGEIALDQGPLMVLENSHTFEDLIAPIREIDYDSKAAPRVAAQDDGVKLARERGTRLLTARFHPGDAVIFAVTDRGIGIPKEDHARLFEIFHRAKNVGNVSGTGLGLAIVKRALDLSGGEIRFETEVGKYHALEINVRPPGGYSMDMMNYSADIDLYRAWARLVVHGENELDYERKHHVAHVGRREGERYRLNHDQIVKDLPVKFVHHPPMPHLWRPVMGDQVYLIGDPDLETLKRGIEMIEARA